MRVWNLGLVAATLFLSGGAVTTLAAAGDGGDGANGQDGEDGRDGQDGWDGLAPDIPVATAYAAPIVATVDTCMGASSFGAQGLSFGMSVAATWQDETCRRIKNARQLATMGYRGAAAALLCGDDEVRAAMEIAGSSETNS